MRLKLSELGSPVNPVNAAYDNTLLRDRGWVNEVNWLRDMYNDIVVLWKKLHKSEQDKLAFTEAEPKLSELISGLLSVSYQVTWLPEIGQKLMNIRDDFETSIRHAKAGEYALGVLFQSYSLVKIKVVLDSLIRESKRPSSRRVSSIEKKAYGYDISGEVFEGSGELANRENQKNIDDTAEPQDHHETPPNPLNLTRDVDAEKEYPSLQEFKDKRVYWPPRMR